MRGEFFCDKMYFSVVTSSSSLQLVLVTGNFRRDPAKQHHYVNLVLDLQTAQILLFYIL